jgi:hypothetical protein
MENLPSISIYAVFGTLLSAGIVGYALYACGPADDRLRSSFPRLLFSEVAGHHLPIHPFYY